MRLILHNKNARMRWVLVVFQLSFTMCASFGFDRNYFGVAFNPFTNHDENVRGIADLYSYDFENVKTMLTVISKKFSRVFVQHASPDDGLYSYSYNQTYYHHSYVTIYTGEAAAMINKESGRKLLTVLYCPTLLISPRQFETSLLLTFEAAEKANKIFQGTVEGIIIHWNLMTLETQLQQIRQHKSRASELGIKLGVYLHYDVLFTNHLRSTRQQLINESDQVVIGTSCEGSQPVPPDCFSVLSDDFLKMKHSAYSINHNTEVIGCTRWYNSGPTKRENIEFFKQYWQIANRWSIQNKFKIFLNDAFDNPRKSSVDYMGWWKLKENSKINLVEGYVETINEEGNVVTTDSPLTEEGNPVTTDSSIMGENSNSGIRPSATLWNEVTISVTATGGIIIVLACTLLLYFFIFRRKKIIILTADELRDFMSGVSNKTNTDNSSVLETTIRSAYDTSLEIPKDKLKIDSNKVLGSGEFGLVLRAWIESYEGEDVEVALKIAKDNCNSSVLKGLLAEIKIMTYVGRHPHIVILKGAYTAELAHGIVYIATELCALGSLKGYLNKNNSMEETVYGPYMSLMQSQEMELTPTSIIPLSDMVRWSHEIACGMEYLERKHVVHADLATRNVLLTSEKTAKISDFGLSRRMYNYANYVKKSSEPLPWRWMAIEALKKMEFSAKTDVWSYGITLWEIFSKGDAPYPGLSWNQLFVTKLVSGLRPDCPAHATAEIYNFMRECWNIDPKERPSFNDLVTFTEVALRKCGAPIEGETLYK